MQKEIAQRPTPRVAAGTDVHALQMKREELKSQLQSLTERRMLIGMQQRDARGSNAERDLDRSLKELDARTARIDAELNKVDDAITQALDRDIASQDAKPVPVPVVPVSPPFIAGPEAPWTIQPGGPPFHESAVAREMMQTLLVFGGLQLALLAVIAWRWLRAKPAAGAVRLAAEDSNRIDQLQRAVDVIAVEVERISESQRFVNKALGAGAAENIKASKREQEPAR